MSTAAGFDFGTVMLVPFPFSDQSGFKKRPAVAVSGRAYNTSRRDVVIMAITSQIRSAPGFAEGPVTDWQSAGLLKPSVFKPVFATIEQALVIRQLGSLSAQDESALRCLLDQLSR